MGKERIYDESEIQDLMRKGYVFCTSAYGTPNEIWWDIGKQRFMYTNVHSGHIENASGCLTCGETYTVVRIVESIKRINPWSV